MSYERLKSFSFNKDFTSFTTSVASSNVRPLCYKKVVVNKKEDVSSLDFVKNVVENVIDGNYQFDNRQHLLNVYIDLHLSFEDLNGKRDLWYIPYDFDKNYHYEKGFSSEEKEKEYKLSMEYKNKLVEKIALSFMKKDLRQFISQLKAERYIIANDYFSSFVSSFTKRGFYRTTNFHRAKVINGIEKMYLPEFMFSQYHLLLVDVKDTRTIIEKLKAVLTKDFLENDFLQEKYKLEDYLDKVLPQRLENIGLESY